MSRGGPRTGAGRPSAFPRGTELERRTLLLPPDVWASLATLAERWGTTPAGAVAQLVGEANAAAVTTDRHR